MSPDASRLAKTTIAPYHGNMQSRGAPGLRPLAAGRLGLAPPDSLDPPSPVPLAPPPPGAMPSPAALSAWLAQAQTGGLSDPTGEGATADFEAAVATYLGQGHEAYQVRTTASGSGALALALLALGPRTVHGQAVLVSALLPPYVVGVIEALGGQPVLVDADWPSFLPDRAALESAWRAVAPRTPVALVTGTGLGLAPSLDTTLAFAAETGCLVIEDAAASLGAVDPLGRPAGTRAHFGVFSLGWGKSLSCGEGGLLVTGSRSLARSVEACFPRPLPAGHPLGYPAAKAGSRPVRFATASVVGGLAGRLSAPAAAMATALLDDLPARQTRRREIARKAGIRARRGLAAQDAAWEVEAFSGPDATGACLLAVRFPDAASASAADTRADAAHLDFPALPCAAPALPGFPSGPGRSGAWSRALDGHARVRLLPWWDSAGANEADVDRMLDAFAYTLTGQAD